MEWLQSAAPRVPVIVTTGYHHLRDRLNAVTVFERTLPLRPPSRARLREMLAASPGGSLSYWLANRAVSRRRFTRTSNTRSSADPSHRSDPALWPLDNRLAGFASAGIHHGENHAEHGCFAPAVPLYEHTGTHLDAPAHYVDSAETVDQISARTSSSVRWLSSISRRPRQRIRRALTIADIERGGASHGAKSHRLRRTGSFRLGPALSQSQPLHHHGWRRPTAISRRRPRGGALADPSSARFLPASASIRWA